MLNKYGIGVIGALSAINFDPAPTDGGSSQPTFVPPTTTTTNGGEADEDETKEVIIGNREGLAFKKMEFKKSKKTGEASAITGWGFASITFESPSQAIAHFDNLALSQGKNDISGKDVVLDLLQGSYDAKLRIKVMAGVPKIGDAGFPNQEAIDNWFKNKAETNPEKLLLGIDEVYAWIPGDRELSAKKQLALATIELAKLGGELANPNTTPERKNEIITVLMPKIAMDMASK